MEFNMNRIRFFIWFDMDVSNKIILLVKHFGYFATDLSQRWDSEQLHLCFYYNYYIEMLWINQIYEANWMGLRFGSNHWTKSRVNHDWRNDWLMIHCYFHHHFNNQLHVFILKNNIIYNASCFTIMMRVKWVFFGCFILNVYH